MSIPEDLQEYAVKLKNLYTVKNNFGSCQGCEVVDAKKFPGGIQAFILNISKRIERADPSELINWRGVMVVALLSGDDKLWCSELTIYHSNTKKISEKLAQCSRYSRLSHGCRGNNNELKFHTFAADYYNFVSFVTARRTNISF